MSSERIDGEFVFHCDVCFDAHESSGEENFVEAWRGAFDAGWRTMNVGRETKHVCPSCAEEM